MNRRIHNSLSALVASSALMAVALIAAAPLPNQPPANTELAAELGTAAALAVAIEQAAISIETGNDGSVSSRSTASQRRDRRMLTMPYFSF